MTYRNQQDADQARLTFLEEEVARLKKENKKLKSKEVSESGTLAEEILEETWQLYKKINALSFTDCSTLALMQEYGIKDIATFGRELKKRCG